MVTTSAKETYHRVYRSVYPFLDNRTRRTLSLVRRKFGPAVALEWLCTQHIDWNVPAMPVGQTPTTGFLRGR